MNELSKNNNRSHDRYCGMVLFTISPFEQPFPFIGSEDWKITFKVEEDGNPHEILIPIKDIVTPWFLPSDFVEQYVYIDNHSDLSFRYRLLDFEGVTDEIHPAITQDDRVLILRAPCRLQYNDTLRIGKWKLNFENRERPKK